MLAFLGALFGLIVGSFLNVVILRHGVRSLGGRSSCPHCNHQLRYYDLIPVFSWVFLRGACRYCRSAISPQYPIVEALTALLFAIVWGGSQSLYGLACGTVIGALLVCIAVYDVKHTIIPTLWAYLFALIALIYHVPDLAQPANALNLLLGALSAVAPLLILWGISRGRWMGFGDVKLALGIGLLLGFPVGLAAVMCSFIIGTLVLLPFMAARVCVTAFTHSRPFLSSSAGLTMKSEVPFGPFLIASCLLFWFLQLYGIPLDMQWLAIA